MQAFSRSVLNRISSTVTRPSQLIPGISAGLVAAIIHIIVPVSFAALIFSDRLSGYISEGIGIMLLGSTGALIINNLFRSYNGLLTISQDAPATIIAAVSAGLVRGMPASIPAQEVFLTVAIAMAASSLLTGLAGILLGKFHLGALIRYLPYPVIGGFLAGTGWLLVLGGVGMMASLQVNLGGLAQLVQPVTLLRWLPGLLFAGLMLVALNRLQHFLVLPGLIFGEALSFFFIAGIAGIPLNQLFQQGWLLGPLPAGGLSQHYGITELRLVNWGDIMAQTGSLVTVALVSIVSFLLNISAIEIITRHDVNLDRELKVMGAGNLLSGLLGGPVNYPTPSTTSLNHRLGKDSRLAGWIIVLIYIAVIGIGTTILNYIPKMVLGSLLVLLGLFFLQDWVFRAWRRFPPVEFGIILLILGVIAVFGYLTGVAAGLLAAIALFVVNYSQINVIKHERNGREYQSRVTRSPVLRQFLQEHGEEVLILQLQGYLFFGTANHLFERIRQQAKVTEQDGKADLEYLILDFAATTGLDSTALLSFEKLRLYCENYKIHLCLSGLSHRVFTIFQKASRQETWNETYFFPDLDHAMEWVENQILDGIVVDPDEKARLESPLDQLLSTPGEWHSLLQYFQREELAEGTYLVHQGDTPDEVFLIESGQITAQLESPGKEPVRLETMQGGRVIGEIGFYLGIPRTAAVVVNQPSVVYKLSHTGLQAMELNDPECAAVFHKLLAKLLAERTVHLTRSINALER